MYRMTSSRRDFLGVLGTAMSARAAVTEPGLILHHANIHTIDSANPHAEAVAIADGRFLAVGSNQDVLALATARTRKVDMGNSTIVPGFIDGHTHVAESGLLHLRRVDCDLRSIAEIIAAIRQRASQVPKGEWVLGFKYDDTKTAEGRKLTRADLDQAAADHPVFIEHRGGHTAYVNSTALRVVDINEATPDPKGGQFDRDTSGRLTGGLRENATERLKANIPKNYSREERRQGVKLMTQRFASTGVTSVHDAEGAPEDLLAYQDALEAGELRVRVYHFLFYPYIDRMIAAGIRTGMGNEWIRVGGMKLVADGSISERTARLSQPYVGRPSDYGILVMGEEELYTHARKAHAAGWQIGIHANGDVGIDTALRVYERLQREMPRRDPRFRLEHCTVINDGLIRRMKALGAIPTPFSTYVYYHGEKMREYGAERLNSMFALRSFLDAGIRATQASDYPPGPFEPMMALQSEVTRTDSKGNSWGPKQKISVEEALRVGTLHGAYASFEEKTKGSIECGKLADLVVLARDPKREDPGTIVTIPVERTMTGGQWVYEA
ncbi:MAG TPA: amidohydrolase [Bryobacteraceae bacterium]|nr:amidohydrolase [Bryobacteraceae bacterium]